VARRPPHWAALLAAVVVLLAGCGGSSESQSHRLGLPGDPKQSVGITLPNFAPNKPYVVYVANPCLKSGGPIDVTGVQTVRPEGDMKILDWGVRNRYPGDPYGANVGALPGTLADVVGFAHTPVKSACSSGSDYSQLDVVVATTGPDLAVSHGFRINYKDGTKSGQVISLLILKLCSGVCPTT
jgi:hypothetical protein